MSTNPNLYFSSFSALPRNQLARCEAVNAIFNAVISGFNQLPDPAPLVEDRVTYCGLDTGAVNAFVITPPTPIQAYNPGAHFSFVASTTNTGACTINNSGLGVRQFTRADGTALLAGDITEGMIVDIRDDGTKYQLTSLPGTSVASATASATAAAASATAAAASATAAATSATNAANSATAAAASAASLNLAQGTFTPIDQSGANLTFTVIRAKYTEFGDTVLAELVLSFPITANSSAVVIGLGNLPAAANVIGVSGMWDVYWGSSPFLMGYMVPGTNNFSLYDASGSIQHNSGLSGATIRMQFHYSKT